jgi:MFS transporter, DHA1 family, tetracycline resistance protein
LETRLKPLRALCIVVIIDVLGFGVLIPLIPYMAIRYGASPELNTPILGIYSLCQLLAAPLWGRLSDRYGRRPILLSSMLGACGSYLILAFTHSLASLFLSRALAGFMAGNLAAAMAYASDISAPADRAKTMGMVGAAIGVGFMLGPLVGGALAGEHLQTANFLRPALLSACLSVLAMMLVLFMLPESRGRAQRAGAPGLAQQPRGAVRLPAWQLLRVLPGLRLLSLATLLVTFSQSTLESIFAIWAVDRYHVGPRTIGITFFVLAIVAVAAQGGLVRKLAPRFGEHRLALAGIAGYVFGLATVAYGPDLALVIVGLVLCGLGAGLFNPSGAALASHQAQAYNRGAIMGVYQAGTSSARVIAPFVSGWVYTRLGPGAPYLLAALVTLQAAWCVLSARSVPGAEAVRREVTQRQ